MGKRRRERLEEKLQLIEEIEELEMLDKCRSVIVELLEDQSRSGELDPCPHCRYVEKVTSLLDLEPQDTSDPAVRCPTCVEVGRRILDELGMPDMSRDEDFAKWLGKAVEIFRSYIWYDTVHANASREWRSLAYTYMTAEETMRLGRGICGEMSLALISTLRSIGIPASLYRPYLSHIAVVVENPVTGTKFEVDPTFGIVKMLGKSVYRKKVSEDSNYTYGAVKLEEFWRTTLRKRRRLGEKYIGRRYSPEEALDYEYARHCIEPLPYSTERGVRYLQYLKDIGYCLRTFRPEERYYAELFARIASRCPRPEDEEYSIEEKAMCYRSAWEEFRNVKKMLDREMEKILEV